jgi:hypothetical protein
MKPYAVVGSQQWFKVLPQLEFQYNDKKLRNGTVELSIGSQQSICGSRRKRFCRSCARRGQPSGSAALISKKTAPGQAYPRSTSDKASIKHSADNRARVPDARAQSDAMWTIGIKARACGHSSVRKISTQ